MQAMLFQPRLRMASATLKMSSLEDPKAMAQASGAPTSSTSGRALILVHHLG
jgi:hypothetical protein